MGIRRKKECTPSTNLKCYCIELKVFPINNSVDGSYTFKVAGNEFGVLSQKGTNRDIKR